MLHPQVDFWKPDSPDLVTTGMKVDIHVPAAQLDMVFTILQQSDMEAKYVFDKHVSCLRLWN